MSRRRGENRKRLRKDREAKKQRALQRITDPPTRGDFSGPVMAYDLTAPVQTTDEAAG